VQALFAPLATLWEAAMEITSAQGSEMQAQSKNVAETLTALEKISVCGMDSTKVTVWKTVLRTENALSPPTVFS
jgi:hypothetical protein